VRLWRRLSGKHLDQRVADAKAEAEKSRQRQEAARKHVVAPLRQAGAQNKFAESIARSLAINGNRGHR